ncbi:hypothetical protein [Mammaliicoccus sciuri]|uniref:hypothetical protein n=1 Tax=Mammaliicoccus sciuri TaxID=1296 RepID=UPI00195009B8|nr:hypothetical protein [Mammaliicoccus sciuri]
MEEFETYPNHLQEVPICILNNNERYIILLDTEDNIENFKQSTKNVSRYLLNQFKIYYNTSNEYWKIVEGMKLRKKLKEEREYQSFIEKPPISEEIKNISNKDELVEYLLKERYESVLDYINERSIDDELDKAILNAEQEELKRLTNKFL